jgi:hypothetical protein
VLPEITIARQRIAAAKEGKSAEAQRQLGLLSVAIVDVLSQIGAGSTDEDAESAVDIGAIRTHEENSGKVPRDAKKPWLALESEHVIPVAFVSDLFHTLGDEKRIVRGSPEDELQHTILVYKGAASPKTYGSPIGGGGKTGLADSNVINWARNIRKKGAPNLEGRSRVARGHKELGAGEQAEREQLWQGLTVQERTATLRTMLPDRMAERIDDLMHAIEADHTKNGDKRKETQATPDRGKVRAAAVLQVQDIITIFVNRLS